MRPRASRSQLKRNPLGGATTVTHAVRSSTTRAGRAFYTAAISTALAVGALQMFHVRGGLLTNYGADVFGTAWLYAMTRQGRTIIQRGRTTGATSAVVLVFALCAASELGQRAHLLPGYFDPYDIVAYGVTVAACWGLDRRFPFVQSA